MTDSSILYAVDWYCSLPPAKVPNEVCPTRDIFQARLDTFYQEITLRSLLSEEEAALFAAVAGEIGNNCFDHNLGNWPDQIGCWFSWAASKKNKDLLAAIADRGQGVLSSLKHIKPDLKTEEDALRTAILKRS